MSKSLNKVTLLGRLGKDPEIRYTTNGKAVTTFDVATGGDNWTDAQGQTHEEKTEWSRCVAWERLGEIAGEYLAKGKQVYLEGKLQTRSWEDDKGVKRYSTEILVKDLVLLGGKGDSHADAPHSAAPAPAMTGKPQPAAQSAKPMPSEAEMAKFLEESDIPF